jgi:hypothetical protein
VRYADPVREKECNDRRNAVRYADPVREKECSALCRPGATEGMECAVPTRCV